VYCGGIA
jgi:hypothetical protein